MGAWGAGPLENDAAADWLHDLFEGTHFAERVADGLASQEPEEVRAAAWLIGALGRVYVWPIDRIDADRAAARAALEKLLADEEWLSSWADRGEIEQALREQLDAIPGATS